MVTLDTLVNMDSQDIQDSKVIQPHQVILECLDSQACLEWLVQMVNKVSLDIVVDQDIVDIHLIQVLVDTLE